MTGVGPARHGTCVTTIGVALLVLAGPATTRAQSRWSAPSECGTRAAIDARIVELAPELRGLEVPYAVSIARDGETYRAALAMGGETRALESGSCATLASAIAVIVSTAAVAEREDAARGEAAPAQVVAASNGTAAPEGITVRMLLAGEAVVAIGPLPNVEWSLVPTLGIHVEGVELHASIVWLGFSAQSVTAFLGHFRLGYAFALGDFDLGPYVASDVGQLASTSVGFYSAVGAGVVARWWPDRIVGIQLSGDVTVPVASPVLSDGYEAAVVTALLGAGVILRFP